MSLVDNKIVFYDVASNITPVPFSPNTLVTRFVLNYKRIPYRTVFLHMPDIAEQLKTVGMPPTRTAAPFYTVPAIVAPSGSTTAPTLLADSFSIAQYLEREYPEPRLFGPDEDGVTEQQELVQLVSETAAYKMLPINVPATLDIFDQRDAEYFQATRKAAIGFSVEELIASGTDKEKRAALEAGLDELARIIDERTTGSEIKVDVSSPGPNYWPFGGTQPAYADFQLCAFFLWLKTLSAEDWERVKARNEGKWGRLYLSCEPYMQAI